MSRQSPHNTDIMSEAELLEQHVLARSSESAHPSLQRFRLRNPQLIRVTDTVIAVLRTRVHSTPDETDRSLAQVKAAWRTVEVPPAPSSRKPSDSWITRGIHSRVLPRFAPIAFGALMALALVTVVAVREWTRTTTGDVWIDSQQFSTTNGQRASIDLPDGSQVILGVNSRMILPHDYRHGNRTIRLSGEALFTVASSSSAPFTVLTGQTATRVLGTTFVVRQYDNETAATVAVRDGKVVVYSSADSTVLTGGQQTRSEGGNPLTIQPVTSGRFDFAQGILSLSGLSLGDAIPDLDRWFDVDIQLSDRARVIQLATRRMRLTVTTNSVIELAAMLELAFDVRVIRQGRRLILDPK